MNKFILLLVGLFLAYTTLFGQKSGDRMMFVIDSIPVIDDPEEGNEIPNAVCAVKVRIAACSSRLNWFRIVAARGVY